MQQVAGSVASRGLGSSPAGASLAAAEQAVFSNAQQLAAAQEQIVNREAFIAASELVQRDAGFFEDLKAISATYAQIRAMGGQVDTSVDATVLQYLGLADVVHIRPFHAIRKTSTSSPEQRRENNARKKRHRLSPGRRNRRFASARGHCVH